MIDLSPYCLAYGAARKHDDAYSESILYRLSTASLTLSQAFCERVQSEFKGVENVEIFVRDEGLPSKVFFFRHDPDISISLGC